MKSNVVSINNGEPREVSSLQLITGGKDGGHNWLTDLENGTMFLCELRVDVKTMGLQAMKNPGLAVYWKVNTTKGGNVILMDGQTYMNSDSQVRNFMYVNPRKFVQVYDLVEIVTIEEGMNAPAEEEETDGQGDQDRPS